MVQRPSSPLESMSVSRPPESSGGIGSRILEHGQTSVISENFLGRWRKERMELARCSAGISLPESSKDSIEQ